MATYKLKSKLFAAKGVVAPRPKPGVKPVKPTKPTTPRKTSITPTTKPARQITPNNVTTSTGGQGGNVTINLTHPSQGTPQAAVAPTTQTMPTVNQELMEQQSAGGGMGNMLLGAGLGVAGTIGYGMYKAKKARKDASNEENQQEYDGGYSSY